jgi:hypothetical protein
MGQLLTEPAAVLSLIVQVMKWTMLLKMATPPPCEGEDDFSSFTTLHWSDGRRFEKV